MLCEKNNQGTNQNIYYMYNHMPNEKFKEGLEYKGILLRHREQNKESEQNKETTITKTKQRDWILEIDKIYRE